jgi:phage N-6-adenine-methyltransferase
VHCSGESAEWSTPPQIISRVERVLGCIDLDPCSSVERTISATRVFNRDDDGLRQEWRGLVFMNPPYDDGISKWVEKLLAEYTADRTKQAIALIPARTETQWFRLLRDHMVCFITESAATMLPFPCAAVYMGPQMAVFEEEFQNIGDVWVRWWSGL